MGARKKTDESGKVEPNVGDLKKRVQKIEQILGRRYQQSQERLEEINFVDTLVAIILSQNTNDRNSHRAYQSLRATWPTWEEVAAIDPEELIDSIRVGGLAAQKSATISAVLNSFLERWGSFDLEGVEEMRDDELISYLVSIRGVGLKSATCAMMFALDRDLCAVDTHLHRILNRLGIVRSSNPDKTFRDLRPLIPKGKARRLHVSLIRFGRDICKARLPHCFECPLYDLCEWNEKEEFARGKRQGPRPVSGDFLITDGL